MDKTLEIRLILELQNRICLICDKFKIKKVDISFKYMEEKSNYLKKSNSIVISKDYLENYYYCLALIIDEFIRNDLNENLKAKLEFLSSLFNILSKKKIITSDIKEKLIELGFKEVNIGYLDKHEIKSKELKLDFFSYDIAIGISCRCISYGCNRMYRALVYNFI